MDSRTYQFTTAAERDALGANIANTKAQTQLQYFWATRSYFPAATISYDTPRSKIVMLIQGGPTLR